MHSASSQGTDLARRHAGRFRVVSYEELREKAMVVADQILADYSGQQIVAAPILMGGGLPARLVIDALLPFGVVGDIVPCRLRRYTGLAEAGEVTFSVKLPKRRVSGQIVIGMDDLVDGGQTLEAFREHALSRGAKEVHEAVMFEKPQSSLKPKYCAERGVPEWLIMPGEEHEFMRMLRDVDLEVAELPADALSDYFVALGLPKATVVAWQRLQDKALQPEA